MNKNTVAVVGIGRVGLPLGLVLAQDGFQVYGIGRDQKKMDEIAKGKMPFTEQGADVLLKKYVNKSFSATTDYSVIATCGYIILTLGTPIDENMNPVFSQIDAALKSMKPFIKEGQTLILRSTVAPRTTEYVKLWLEDIEGIEVGKNYYLAFCPERIAEGFAIEENKSIPQIVGGVDKISTRRAGELFKKIGVEVLPTDDVSAELAKLFTNMYRYISFAIANEFMMLAENHHRDIYEIVHLINHNYKRGGLGVPGLTGGPCLFKDGFFLISDMPFTDLITTSWKINESVPLHLIRQVRERMKLDGKQTVIMGLGFKAGTDDIRESLSFKVRKALLRERANVILQDPYVTEYVNQPIEKDVYKAIENADLLFIGANHKEYRDLDVKKIVKLVNKRCIICDVWNVLGTDKIVFSVSQLVNGEKTDKKYSSKNSTVFIATFAPYENGERLPANGMVEPLVSFFTHEKIKHLVMLIQPHTGSDRISPIIEEYRNGNFNKTSILSPWYYFPLYLFCKYNNKPRTLISFKLRDFLSVLLVGFLNTKRSDYFIALESINTMAGILLRKIGKVKTVIYYVSDYSPNRFGDTAFNKVYVWMDRFCAKHSDIIWDVSPAMQPARVSAGLKQEESAPEIIMPNGLFPDQIGSLPVGERLPYSLVFMGSLGYENGPDLAIESLLEVKKKFPKVKLHIVGGGQSNLDRLKKLVKKLKLEDRVIFYGFVVDNVEMSKIVRKCYIALAPYRAIPNSVRWYADATKIRQYLASGLPVISTQVPPLGKKVADEGAAIVAQDTKKEYAQAIINLLKDDELYKKMERRARTISKENTWINEYQKAFAQIAKL